MNDEITTEISRNQLSAVSGGKLVLFGGESPGAFASLGCRESGTSSSPIGTLTNFDCNAVSSSGSSRSYALFGIDDGAVQNPM